MHLSKESFDKAPVWVNLYNIPLEYWNAKGLSYIASAIGRPLYADSMTESRKRISFARICVELDVSSDLIDSFELDMGDDEVAHVHVSLMRLVRIFCFVDGFLLWDGSHLSSTDDPHPMFV